MEASKQMIEALKGFEGLRTKAYKAVKTEHYYTIGYGHYGADVKAGMTITAQEAEKMLLKDLMSFEKFVNGLNVCKTQGQYDALVDFVFNCGTAALSGSTLLRKIRANATLQEIQNEFRKWNKSGGKVLAGLVRRREWEAQRYAE